MITRRILLATPAIIAARPSPPRVGVLTTLSGPAADGAGSGSVLAARLALDDAGSDAELLSADMGSSPDTGAAIARAWFDSGIHAVIDVPNSATALAVASLARARNRVALFSGAGAASLLGCAPNHIQWTYNTTALATAAGRAVLENGGRRWFFITADYAFGHVLQADATRVVEAGGGAVLGGVAAPGEAGDLSSYLLAARESGADVVALACTGGMFETAVKQAAEFGIRDRLAALLCLETNVHAIGLADAQGLLLATPFSWTRTDATRAFAARFALRNRGIHPNMVHAGVYAATRHYLRAAGDLDGAATVARMRALPVEDALFSGTELRADGSAAHPMHLMRVKSPGESASEWDFYTPLRTVSAADAFGAVASNAACKV